MAIRDDWSRPEDPLLDDYKFRRKLPSETSKKHENSQFWSLMKSNIGKDLSKTVMPIQLNEPISFLQRICECLENSHLIFQASIETDPIIRMEMITAFVISAVSSSNNRTGKPFNPLLGETYELNRRENRGYMFVSEQVSHHPPISAFYAESSDSPRTFTFWGSLLPKIKFSGTSLEIRPKGNVYLELENHEEIYSWQNPTYCVNNLLMGKATITYQGETTIRCSKTQLQSTIKWKSGSNFFKSNDDLGSKNRVEAYINKDNSVAESKPKSNGIIFKQKSKGSQNSGEDLSEDGLNSHNNEKDSNPQSPIDNNPTTSERRRVLYGKWSEVVYSVSEDVWKNRHKQRGCPQSGTTDKASKQMLDSPFSGMVSKLGSGMRFFHHNSTQNIQNTVTETGTVSSLDVPDSTISNTNIRKSYSPVLDRRSHRHHGNPHHHNSSSTSSLDISDSDEVNLQLCEQQCLWKRGPLPSETGIYFNFSYYTMLLNESTEEQLLSLPPTDSRLRPDIRLLEEGDMEEAESEKLRLETKQRARQKDLKQQSKNNKSNNHKSSPDDENGEVLKTAPLWFEFKLSTVSNEDEWLFNNKYFHRNWEQCIDIF